MTELSQNSSTEPTGSRNRWAGLIVGLAIGFVVGVGVTALVGWKSMPSMMLNIHESRYQDVDRTCVELKKAIEANGWSCPAIRNMNKAMAKHGVQFDRPVRIVELCKADYAKRILTTNAEMLTLMPCAWGVYEGADGKVWISGMNTGLMGKMFGGTIAEVLGKDVAADEKAMLKSVTKP